VDTEIAIQFLVDERLVRPRRVARPAFVRVVILMFVQW
jgi:hypothetical protein